MGSNESAPGSGRRRISDENLHISSFDIVRREPDSVLFIRATDAYPSRSGEENSCFRRLWSNTAKSPPRQQTER